jgi:hypothetical protein
VSTVRIREESQVAQVFCYKMQDFCRKVLNVSRVEDGQEFCQFLEYPDEALSRRRRQRLTRTQCGGARSREEAATHAAQPPLFPQSSKRRLWFYPWHSFSNTGCAERELQGKRKRPSELLQMAVIYVGDDLLSHTLSRAVQSARRGLTSVFGMGTGISPAVKSPASLTWALRPLGPRRGLHAGPGTSNWKEQLAISN